MLRLKALYKAFGISRPRVFPGRKAQEAFLGPLVVTTTLAPGWKRHQLLVKSGTGMGLCPHLIGIAAMLHDCSRAVAAVFVKQNLPLEQVYMCLLSEAFTEVFWWEFYK